jgi:hypothetical protein
LLTAARRAHELKDYFEKKWEHVREGIISKYQEEKLLSAVETSASEKQAKSQQLKRDRTGLSVKRIIENEKFDNSTPLKVDEKKTLSANMNKLPCKKLGKIVEIIHARHPTVLRCVFLVDAAFLRAFKDAYVNFGIYACGSIRFLSPLCFFPGKATPTPTK